MESVYFSLHILDRIWHHCTPWTKHCLGLASKEWFEHFKPVKYNSQMEYYKTYKGCIDPRLLKEMDNSGQFPFGYVFGNGLTFRKIQGYSCVFTCSNYDGDDQRLQNWLVLIDDFWRQKLPKCLKYMSFIEENGRILGSFDPSKYRPTMDVEGDLCKTKAQKARADCGLLNSFTSGDVSMDLEATRGYEVVHLLLCPFIEGSTFRIQVFVDSADLYCS